MISVRASTSADLPRLLEIWRSAVRATHDFLLPGDFEAIEQIVAEQYLPEVDFWVAADEHDRPLGFMGRRGGEIDALFVDAEVRGRGVGRLLVEHAASEAGALSVDVNEQNIEGVGFYEHLGFVRTGWSASDGMGRPYPILHMARPVRGA